MRIDAQESASEESSAKLTAPRTKEVAGKLVERANAGDHGEIHELLVSVFQAPSRDAFLAALEDPLYEPTDRLVVRRHGQIVAHAHVTKREMKMGPLRVAASGLNWLATSAEFRSRGFSGQLVEAAERQMREDGALLGVLQTRIPHFFRRRGWAVCGRCSVSQAGVREVRGAVEQRVRRPVSRPVLIRPWRQVELPALMNIYEQRHAHAFGPWHRSEAHWRWLVTRPGGHQFWVAIDGADRADLVEQNAAILGYAVTRDNHILELITAEGHNGVSLALLDRICQDALERDRREVLLHAPPRDPLHTIFTAAGGKHLHHESDAGVMPMVKLLDPSALIERLAPLFQQRLQAHELTSCELGLVVDDQKYLLKVSANHVELSRDKIGRSYLSLNVAEFTRLLLGHQDLQQAFSQSRIVASTRIASDAATILFPPFSLWRSPLDDGK